MSHIASIRPADLTALAWSSLKRNQLRSSLTIGAVALGIAVMMYLISLGLGLEQLTIGEVSNSATLKTLSVNAVDADQRPLDASALAQIKAVPKATEVLPELTLDGQAVLNSKQASVTLQGVDPDFLSIGSSTQLAAGRYFRDDDQADMVVTTGFLKVFGLESADNGGIKVPLVSFNIVPDQSKFPGMATLENIEVTGVVTDDEAIQAYLPLPYLQGLISSGSLPPYTTAEVRVSSLDDVQGVADHIRDLGFRVDTVTDTVTEIKQVFRYVQWTLGVLGAIAIAVASIGMFNTLTISLLERTKEIGIMKALGVRQGDIRRLFLTEATLMGLIGGLAGIGLAVVLQQLTLFVFSLLAQYLNGTVPQLFVNKLDVVAGFILFGVTLALLTGLYPARRAMRLRPIEAIRYE